MKITICGSMVFADEMKKAIRELEGLGHDIRTPPFEIQKEDGTTMTAVEYHRIRQEAPEGDEWVWERKAQAIRDHFEKVEWSDGILVLNYGKNGIENYVGANTFLEMGLAFHLKKPIYLLNPIPDMPCKEELIGMKPVVINGDLGLLGAK